jgi:hypothetical protein
VAVAVVAAVWRFKKLFVLLLSVKWW